MSPTPTAEGLSDAEMMSLLYDYIGVDGGYLWGFSYRTHEEFYPRFCNVMLDVAKLREQHGTTRNTFLAILRNADPPFQTKIVEGVFAYLPIDRFPEEAQAAKVAAKSRLQNAVARIRGQAVEIDDLAVKNETVERAIQDAAVLIREQGNTSGVDRVHTALHGYLRALCAANNVTAEDDADAARLLRLLRLNVPRFRPGVARQEDVARIQGALGTIVDALSPIRNQATLAHPNEALLDVAEAALAIDAARTVLNYVNRKLQ
jgi:hypothetical protein